MLLNVLFPFHHSNYSIIFEKGLCVVRAYVPHVDMHACRHAVLGDVLSLRFCVGRCQILFDNYSVDIQK